MKPPKVKSAKPKAEAGMVNIPDKKTVPNEYGIEAKSKTKVIDPRPQFSANEDVLPAIKDWSVGKKYPLEVMVEMTGSRIGGQWDDENKGKLVADFRICGIAVDDDADEKDKKPEPETKESKFKKVTKGLE